MDFNTEVIEASKSAPIVVKFEAHWCGPCRMIKPFLTKAADTAGIKLVSIDVDKHPAISKQFAIRSVPSIFMFKGGKIVSKYPHGGNPLQLSTWLSASK